MYYLFAGQCINYAGGGIHDFKSKHLALLGALNEGLDYLEENEAYQPSLPSTIKVTS